VTLGVEDEEQGSMICRCIIRRNSTPPTNGCARRPTGRTVPDAAPAGTRALGLLQDCAAAACVSARGGRIRNRSVRHRRHPVHGTTTLVSGLAQQLRAAGLHHADQPCTGPPRPEHRSAPAACGPARVGAERHPGHQHQCSPAVVPRSGPRLDQPLSGSFHARAALSAAARDGARLGSDQTGSVQRFHAAGASARRLTPAVAGRRGKRSRPKSGRGDSSLWADRVTRAVRDRVHASFTGGTWRCRNSIWSATTVLNKGSM